MARKPAASEPIDEEGYVRPSIIENEPVPDHDGVPVTGTRASLTGAGDGLSESLTLAPIHLPMGKRVMVIVPAEIVSHEYDFVKDGKERIDGEYVETAVLKADGALLVDPDLVRDVVNAHMERIKEARVEADRARREAKGEFQLPLPDGDAPTPGPGAAADDYFDPDAKSSSDGIFKAGEGLHAV